MANYMVVDYGGGRERIFPVTYPPNSRMGKQKPQSPKKPKVEPIAEGVVVKRRKGMGRKFAEAFTGERGFEGMVQEFVVDILVSALKGMISDAIGQSSSAIRDGVDRALYGETRVRARGGRPVYNYAGVRRYPQQYSTISPGARARHEFEDIILENRGIAEETIDRMEELIREYGTASVNDLYDMLGIDLQGDFTAEKWGWDNLRGAEIRPVRDGYLLKLPRTHQLD